MPLVVQYVAVDDDELREYCISACEAFTLRCPKEITHHLPTVGNTSLICVLQESMKPNCHSINNIIQFICVFFI